jgi:hypothetical protein
MRFMLAAGAGLAGSPEAARGRLFIVGGSGLEEGVEGVCAGRRSTRFALSSDTDTRMKRLPTMRIPIAMPPLARVLGG